MRLIDLLRRAPTLVAFAALALGLAFVAADPGGFLTDRRNEAFDAYQRLDPRAYTDMPVLVVDIDDASLDAVGQWPWSRATQARLVDRLAAAGAAVIAFDMVFPEPDRTGPGALLEVYGEAAPAASRAALAALPDPDGVFADAIARAGNVVLAAAPREDEGQGLPARKASFATAGDDPRQFLPDVPGAVGSLTALEARAAGVGSIAFVADRDLVVRRLPLLSSYGGELYPSLALEALRVAYGARTLVVKASGASGEEAMGERTGIVSLKVGPTVVPTDPEGRLLMHYTPRTPARTLSAVAALKGDFEPGRVEGKIVFIGTSAAGLRDLRPSPLDPVMPGVEAHAQAVEQILAEATVRRPDWAYGVEWLVTVMVGALLALVVTRLNPWLGVGAYLAVLGMVALGGWHAWTAERLLLDPFPPLFVSTLVFVVGLATSYLRTDGEKRQIRGAFGRYLSPHLVDELAAHPERLKLGGETREMSFLFCDVRGFTRISESLKDDPQALTRLVNRFLTPLTDEILQRGGTIDKYMGDCIMAFWNAPLDQADHAVRACDAALAMMAALDRLNATLAAEAKAEGRPFHPLAVGIGINTGNCVVGNMGSEQRFDYSVLGDAVNLAARLEGQSKTYGVNIVVGERTRALAPDWAALELDLIAVKGKAEAVRIFTLQGPPGSLDGELAERHEAMLGAYRAGEVAPALEHLEDCAARAPHLAGLYALYRARLEAFRSAPPPPDWDGVFVALTK